MIGRKIPSLKAGFSNLLLVRSMSTLVDFDFPILIDSTRLLWPAILLVASVLLFRCAKGWPTVLLLVGSASLLLVRLREFVLGLGIQRGWIHPGTFWFPTDTENQAITIPFIVLQNLVLCFAIGFLWYVLRTRRKT